MLRFHQCQWRNGKSAEDDDWLTNKDVDHENSSERVFDGKWKNGKKHGKGKETRFFGVDTTKSKWEDVRSIETVYEGEWKEGKIWNGEKNDKDGKVTSTFVNGEEKEESN